MKATLTLVLVLLLAGGTFFVVRQGMLPGERDARPPARLPDRAPPGVCGGAPRLRGSIIPKALRCIRTSQSCIRARLMPIRLQPNSAAKHQNTTST